MRRTACVAAIIGALVFADCAAALPLSPLDFASLGTLSTTEDVVVDTDSLQLSGGASFTGVRDSVSGAAVFAFDTIQAANISIIGSNSLALLSKGDAVFSGIITSSNSGDIQIAAAGILSVAGGGSISTLNGASLSIFPKDVLLDGGSGAVPGGEQVLATTLRLAPQGPVVRGGTVSIGSGSGTNLFHSFDAFNIGSGEVELFIGSGGEITTRTVAVSGANPSVIVGVVSVPEPPMSVLSVWGLIGLAYFKRRLA